MRRVREASLSPERDAQESYADDSKFMRPSVILLNPQEVAKVSFEGKNLMPDKHQTSQKHPDQEINHHHDALG